MADHEFRAWPKIGRLNRETIVTEKIDGTNAQILVPDDPAEPLLAGCRTRWISPGKSTDNFGFAAWVEENSDALRAELGPGRHYGEWFGKGIQRGYGLDDRQFALFNVSRWHEDITGEPNGLTVCTVVPVLGVYERFDTRLIKSCLHDLRTYGSYVNDFDNPEGLIVFHPQSRQSFKVTLDGDDHGKAHGG